MFRRSMFSVSLAPLLGLAALQRASKAKENAVTLESIDETPIAPNAPVSRQQRRYAERQAAKKAKEPDHG